VGGDTAEEGTYITGPTQVTTRAAINARTSLLWSGEHVQDDSCLLTGSNGFQSTANTGYIPIDLSGGGELTFTLSCRGEDDGVLYQVELTLHPLPASAVN